MARLKTIKPMKIARKKHNRRKLTNNSIWQIKQKQTIFACQSFGGAGRGTKKRRRREIHDEFK